MSAKISPIRQPTTQRPATQRLRTQRPTTQRPTTRRPATRGRQESKRWEAKRQATKSARVREAESPGASDQKEPTPQPATQRPATQRLVTQRPATQRPTTRRPATRGRQESKRREAKRQATKSARVREEESPGASIQTWTCTISNPNPTPIAPKAEAHRVWDRPTRILMYTFEYSCMWTQSPIGPSFHCMCPVRPTGTKRATVDTKRSLICSHNSSPKVSNLFRVGI